MAQWSTNSFQDAESKLEFIMVTDVGRSRVSITDAYTLWQINPNIIFQTGYRIAGTPEDIETSLLPLGISTNEIDNLINTSINSDNYNTEMASVYNDEIKLRDLIRRSEIKANNESPGFKLSELILAINPAAAEKVANETPVVKGQGRKAITKTKARTTSLMERLINIPEGQVLDVSALTVNGTGTKYIPPPQRAKKYGSPNLPMVSADLEHYVRAIDMLPGGRERYADDITYIQQVFNNEVIPQTTFVTQPQAIIHNENPLIPQQLPEILQGTLLPQTEPVYTEAVYPRFTKGERRKRKKQRETDASLRAVAEANPETSLPLSELVPYSNYIQNYADEVPAIPESYEEQIDEELNDEELNDEELSNEELSDEEPENYSESQRVNTQRPQFSVSSQPRISQFQPITPQSKISPLGQQPIISPPLAQRPQLIQRSQIDQRASNIDQSRGDQNK